MDLLAAASSEERTELFSGAADLAAPLFEGTSIAAIPPTTDISFSMLHGLYWLTLNLADEQPLLLCVDDAQWVDRPSLRFLAHLARRLEGAPVGIVVAVRTVGCSW